MRNKHLYLPMYPQCRKWNSIICKDVKLYRLWINKNLKRSRDCLLYTKKDRNCDLFADKITACTTFTSRENVLNTNGYFYLPCIFYEWKYTITWLLWNAMSRDANIEIKLPYPTFDLIVWKVQKQIVFRTEMSENCHTLFVTLVQ